MEQSASNVYMARGVYIAPYLVHGVQVLIAIDSHGVARKHVKLRGGVDELQATERLRALLDRLDPPAPKRPRLELVRETPVRRRPPRTAPVSEKQAYWRSLAQAAAAKIVVYG